MNTQINRLSVPDLPARARDDRSRTGGHSWQIQLTVAMGRAADEPEVLLQPYDLLELFPLLAQLEERAATRPACGSGRATTSATSVRTSRCLRGTDAARSPASCGAGRARSASRPTARSRAARRSRPTAGRAATSASTRSRTSGSARTPLRYTRDRTVEDLWGFCRTCYYADECRAGCTWTSDVLFGRPGNNPFCHHRVLELAAQRQARAAGAGRSGAGPPVRQRALRDRRRRHSERRRSQPERESVAGRIRSGSARKNAGERERQCGSARARRACPKRPGVIAFKASRLLGRRPIR